MKELYVSVYNMLIEKKNDSSWFEGCHKHRIIPGYAGGKYTDDNILYLTQQEHSLIHWLRWKLFRDVRDRRSYRMIGRGTSGLTHEDRVDHGLMCYEKKIGFHSFTPEQRKEASLLGIRSQKEAYELTSEENFYFWSTDVGRKKRASMGGTASYRSGNNPKFLANVGRKMSSEEARLRGAKSGTKPVHNGSGIIRKFKTDEERSIFLRDNPEWKKGTGICPTKGKKMGPSQNRKKVSDGHKVYTSVLEAAISYNVSSATIINWCRSQKKVEWKYVN